MNMILIAIISVTAIGGICGIILAVASKLMYVKVDERVIQLQEILPGANCGACGYPGCSGYAQALSDGKAAINLCTPGGTGVLTKISAILGVEAGNIERKSAVIHCIGSAPFRIKKMEYKGVQTCVAAKQFFGGHTACTFGCLGYGDCKFACPSNAICVEDRLARVIPSLCTGCGLCVKTCPNKLIWIENSNIPVILACNNIEKGAVTRRKCKTGCIACGKCVRECKDNALVIIDNHAKIDYSKCTGCGHCAEVCVSKNIIKNHLPAVS
ncbi:RnfABCDGE type electron transport complex subunit B [Treponema sp. R80B11-R83G3]